MDYINTILETPIPKDAQLMLFHSAGDDDLREKRRIQIGFAWAYYWPKNSRPHSARPRMPRYIGMVDMGEVKTTLLFLAHP